jgi:hypothetical protein
MRLSEMNNQPRAEKINKVVESRFGFKIDYQNLTFKKAFNIVQGLNETLDRAKRTHGVHTAEQNPQYMEMFMVRESLNRWMVENKQQLITESEMAKSEPILAAKDMVDSIQDMLEKIGKMQNEQLPALLDTIRDQIGDQQAETFKGTVTPLLQQLWQQLSDGRTSADSAARQLTGEGGSDMGLGGMGGGDMGSMGGGAPNPEPGLGSDAMGGDEFGATGAAAGGTDELGRERRGGLEEAKKKNDGNLANNAKPYDKVTRGDVVAGRLGKDEMGGKGVKKK